MIFRLIIFILAFVTVMTGCTNGENKKSKLNTERLATNTSTPSNSNTNQSDLVGSVKVENLGTDTKITYSFKNQSEKKVTVVGGARYKLLKDNEVVDEGGVPIKDYLDLEPGQNYTDKKTFSNLEPGSYTIHVDWNKTIVSAEFVRN